MRTLTHYKNENEIQSAPSDSFSQAYTYYLELLVPGTAFQGTEGVP